MAIQHASSKVHWNYFLALENDMETLARYVELHPDNWKVYSIELAHLLFAASSEVDAIAKVLCKQIDAQAPARDINDYRTLISGHFPDFLTTVVHVPRYGLELRPWTNWANDKSPDWWRSYNNVKHERDSKFVEATLENSLNALAGLLVIAYHLYTQLEITRTDATPDRRDVTRLLEPQSSLLRLPEDHYWDTLLV